MAGRAVSTILVSGLAAAWLAVPACTTTPSATPGQTGAVPNNLSGTTDAPCGTYVGDINGVEATATISIEQLPEYVLMSGEITSGTFYYTFTADIIADRGWGDMVDHFDGSRFRVRIDVAADGFLLTANPFLAPTTYSFSCR